MSTEMNNRPSAVIQEAVYLTFTDQVCTVNLGNYLKLVAIIFNIGLNFFIFIYLINEFIKAQSNSHLQDIKNNITRMHKDYELWKSRPEPLKIWHWHKYS